jgi:hypothetical protein
MFSCHFCAKVNRLHTLYSNVQTVQYVNAIFTLIGVVLDSNCTNSNEENSANEVYEEFYHKVKTTWFGL